MDSEMDARELFEADFFSQLPGLDDGLDLDLALFNDDLFSFLGSGELSLPLPLPMEVEEKQPSSTCPQVASVLVENAPRGLAVQRSSGPPTKRKTSAGPMRIVTTELQGSCAATVSGSASPVNTAVATTRCHKQELSLHPQAAVPALKYEPDAPSLVADPVVATSSHSHIKDDNEDSDTDSEDSNDTEEKGLHPNDAAGRANKRKAPDVDWRSIEDVVERRRQRRLAKNRVTAARSRERKKSQWALMEEKMQALEKNNSMLKTMMENLKRENSSLRVQLTSLADGGVMDPSQGGKRPKADPAVVALVIAILLLLASTLPADGATLLLMSGVPLALLMALLSARDGQVLPDVLLHSWASIQALLQSALAGGKKGRSKARGKMLAVRLRQSVKLRFGESTSAFRLSSSHMLAAASRSLAGVTGVVVA